VATQDELCPGYVGERWIGLSLADPLAARIPYDPIDVKVDTAKCDAVGGVQLPLELIVTGPTTVSRTVLLYMVPSQVSFTPREGGRHVVVLREIAHNRWVGKLRVDVEATEKA
jgi:hypothetical protein